MSIATSVDSGTDKIKIYSPVQIGVSSFIGGPCAAVFVLWKNFQGMGKGSAAIKTLVWGGLLVLLILLVLPFLPEKFPNSAIPIATIISAVSVARQSQLSKKAIVESERYKIHSNWNVLGVSLCSILVFLVIFGSYFFLLVLMGIVSID